MSRGHIHIGPDGRRKHVGGCKAPEATPETHPHLYRSVLEVFDPSQLPEPPGTLDYFSDALAALSDIDGNDEVGDCAEAWIVHMVCAVLAAAGAPITLGKADALKLYSLATGYNPSDPSTDDGTDPIALLQYVQKNGIDGKGTHKIAGWLTVPAGNPKLVRQTLTVFGPALMMWLSLPNSYERLATGPGFTWPVDKPNPTNGHCIGSIGYVAGKLTIDTWGLVPGYIEDAAAAALCVPSAGGGMIIILTEEWVNKAKQESPSGLNLAQLTAILDGMGGNAPAVTPPSPVPTPAPAPEPDPDATQPGVVPFIDPDPNEPVKP